MRFFLTSPTHICAWNKAAEEDYCSAQLYRTAAFFAGPPRRAVTNSSGEEAALRARSSTPPYIPLARRASHSGAVTTSVGRAGPTRTNPRRSILLCYLFYLHHLFHIHYRKQLRYLTLNFSAVTTRQPDKQHIRVALLACWHWWNETLLPTGHYSHLFRIPLTGAFRCMTTYSVTTVTTKAEKAEV